MKWWTTACNMPMTWLQITDPGQRKTEGKQGLINIIKTIIFGRETISIAKEAIKLLRTPQHSTIITAEGPLYPEIMNAPKGEHRNLEKSSESSHASIKYGTAETTVPNYAYLCIHCDTLQTKVKKPWKHWSKDILALEMLSCGREYRIETDIGKREFSTTERDHACYQR